MNEASKPAGTPKPDGAWTADELIKYFVNRLKHGDFYILCPDNKVTLGIDAKRILWAANDMILNRPALSRWHDGWKEKFQAFLDA